MLEELKIKNFAIIDDLHIRFSEGLTVFSGETGAGKSIIIQAINLILGHRVTAKQIRSGCESAEIEAFFQIKKGSKTAKVMKLKGLDPDDGLLVRRIISSRDKHRIYINGNLSTVQMLNDMTENLASISGQHAHQGLLQEEQHLLILDQFGNLIPLRNRVHETFHAMAPLIRKIEKLKALKDRQFEQTSLLAFQKNEIQSAAITPGEDIALEQEQKRLKHAETLFRTVQDIVGVLYTNPGAVIESLGEAKKNLSRLCSLDPGLAPRSSALDQTVIQLEDITRDLRDYLNTFEMDENRLEEIEARLFYLQKLKRKYGKSLEEVVAHLDTINRELMEIEHVADRISETESELALHEKHLKQSVKKLSDQREATAAALAKKVEGELATLGMGQTRFKIQVEKNPVGNSGHSFLNMDGHGINDTGIDRAAFLIAPNVGEDLKPLAGIASGGELSRVVLALKAILAQTDTVETVVFDEVDAGIGGKIAEVVGEKLLALSRYYQTICITHLAQIAKFGNHHIHIYKQISRGRTVTMMKPLSSEERIQEIARMIGGVTITSATLEHAQEMLDSVRCQSV